MFQKGEFCKLGLWLVEAFLRVEGQEAGREGAL